MSPLLSHILHIVVSDVIIGAVLGLLLGGIAFAITRLPGLSATSRHAVWTLAIVAIAALPFVAIGRSLVTGHVVVITSAFGAASTAQLAAKNDGTTATVPSAKAVVPSGAARVAPASDVASRTRILMRRGWNAIVLAIWLAGAFVGLVMLAASLVRVSGLKRRSSPLSAELSTQLPWLTTGSGREIMLRLSYEIETPVAVGFRRPVVLIPTELTDEHGLGAIEELVQHEYAHLRRYDDWTNLLQRVAERIFWWNPIVWLIGRRIALEREIAADDCVVAAGAAPAGYAQALWRLAREMRMPEHAAVAPGAFFTRKQISIRIERLLDEHRNGVPRIAPGAVVAAFGFALVASVTVAGIAPAFEITRIAEPLAANPSPAPLASPHLAASPHVAVRATPHPARLSVRPSVVAVLAAGDSPTPSAPPIPTAAPTPSGAPTSTSAPVPSIVPTPTMPPVPGTPRAVPTPTLPPLPPSSPATPSTKRHALELPANVVAEIRAEAARGAREGLAASADALRELVGEKPQDRSPLAQKFIGCVACDLSSRSFVGADLHGLTLTGADLASADFRGANLQGAHLTGVDLSSANLDGADLRNAVLSGVDLDSASLRNVKTDGMRILGAKIANTHLRGTAMRAIVETCRGCNFTDVDFRGADLHGVRFVGFSLEDANFAGANLRGATFSGANLRDANFTNADLRDVTFAGCDMTDASLGGARVEGMRFLGMRPPY